MTIPAPLELHQAVIKPEWVDYNGHMNLAYYVLVFDHATDKLLDYIGLTDPFREANKVSTFAGAMHVNYLGELKQDDAVRVSTQLLAYDNKRIHFFHRLYHAQEGYLAATTELLSLYIDMQQRRVGVIPDSIQEKLEAVVQAHKVLPEPEQLGHVIKVKKDTETQNIL